ncbi:MAG: hypothetical protein IPG45_30160 [Deltaproteobacteria bacterium]|nr:hypothetical protein [Deltaproteobacteria bacterium]
MATVEPSISPGTIVLEVESEEHLKRVRPVVESCLRLLGLRPGWDSYGAESPRPDLVEAALQLLVRMLKQDVPAPTVVPTNRGGLQLEWHLPTRDLEVEVVAHDRFNVIFEDQATGESSDGQFTDIAPILDLVTKLVGT